LPGKIQQIICTGNVCDKETYDYLKTVASDVHVVRGDWDDVSLMRYPSLYLCIANRNACDAGAAAQDPRLPLSLTVTHSPLRIGVIHGHLSVPIGEHDALSAVARQMDVDVLISGHTHKLADLLAKSRLSTLN
jgi:putative phosphoesterase